MTLGVPTAERKAVGFAVDFAEAERKPCRIEAEVVIAVGRASTTQQPMFLRLR